MKVIRCAKGLSRGLPWLVLLALVLAADGSLAVQASPGPGSITDSFTDETKIASKVNLAVEGGQVQLDEVFSSGLYGGASDECFYSVYGDSNYIYAAGETESEGQGGGDALLVKFNIGDLSIASREVYGGSRDDCFYSVYADSNYIYAAGWTNSTYVGDRDALLVKFNSDLSIASKTVYMGNWDDGFYSVYADSNYVYAAGWTYSEGAGSLDALLVKFNSDLNVVSRKVYGGSRDECFYSVYADSNYIYAAGDTSSEGAGNSDALLIKFNIADLSIASRKVYGGASLDWFRSVYADSSHVYAAGYTLSEGAGQYDALLVKFNISDLGIASRKVYGGVSYERFYSVYADSSHVYVAGCTWSEGQGLGDALLVKFNSDLSVASRKVYGGVSLDEFYSVYADSSHVYAAGRTWSEGQGLSDALLVKFNMTLAAGTVPDSCGLVCQDSSLTLANSGLTSGDSNLTLANSDSIPSGSLITPVGSRLTWATCFSSGTLSSTNLLSGQDVSGIDSFGYHASSIPPGAGLNVQFSQDNTSWYSSGGTLGGWDTCAEGSNSIDLSSLGWSGSGFCYKMQLTSDGSNTPVLDEISVTYSTAPAPPTPPSPPRVPTINHWGIVAMIILFAGLLVMKSVQHGRARVAKQ